MKRNRILSLMVLTALLAAPISANNTKEVKPEISKSFVERSSKWFPISLKSDYKGVVESTIYNIVLLKKYYPEADFSRSLSALNKIAENHSDAAVRYKAQLAIMYLNFSDIINVKPVKDAETQDYIFDQISEQLNTKLLVTN